VSDGEKGHSKRRRGRRRRAAGTQAVGATADGADGNGQGKSPRSRSTRHGQGRLRTVHETSAGGLVIGGLDGPRQEQVAALIGRTDRRGRMLWSLPKGHIEIGETADQTAVREVAEETGVCGSVLAALGSIDYWFVTDGRRVHKTVHHYLMQFASGELSDEDLEVAEVAWVPIGDLASRLAYADERRLAQVANDLIEKLQSGGPAALPPLPHTAPRRRPQTHSHTRDNRRNRSAPDRKNGRGPEP
jgi:8-oxo-dGTP pyrophosphatase MutT (NUDIX family)